MVANQDDGRRRRILITGINYAPEPAGIGPYTCGLAEHLAHGGHDVVVLTGPPSYPAWRVADGYRRSLRSVRQEGGVEVRRFRHFVPRHQSAVRRAAYEGTFLVHAAARGPLPWAPDLVVGIVPALSSGVLARLEAARHRAPYLVLFQDLMGLAATESGIAGGGSVAAATRRTEAWVARGAAGVAVVASHFRAYLEDLGVARDRIRVAPNWSRLGPVTESREATRTRLGWAPDEQIVLYTGNLGLKQGLEHLLAAAGLATERAPAARFVFVGTGSQRDTVRAAASGLDNVTFLDLVPDDAYPNLLAAADVLVVTERLGAATMALPSKLTSYFAAGRPVLAAVAPDGGTAGEVQRAGAGLVVAVADPGAIVAALVALRQDPERARRLGEAGARYAATELSPAACLAPMDSLVEAAIRTRGN